MELEIKRNKNLLRNLNITISNDVIKRSVKQEFITFKKNIHIDGFRKGKVPFHILKNNYEKKIQKNVLQKLIHKYFLDKVKTENFHIAGMPKFILNKYEEGKNFNFSIEFEIYPKIELNIDNLNINVPVINITEKDIQKTAYNFLKKQNWEEVNKQIKKNNRITITCINHGSSDYLNKYNLYNFRFIIGKNEILPEIEKKIFSKKVNESFFTNIEFSKYHCEKNIAGKTITTEITITKVEQLKDESLKNHHNSRLDLKPEQYKTIQNLLRNQAKIIIKDHIKTQIIEYLTQFNPIDIPSILIQNSFSILQSQNINSYNKHGCNIFKTIFQQNLLLKAEKQVCTKIFLKQFIKKYSLKPNIQTIQLLIKDMSISNNYTEQLIKLYNSNKNVRQYFNNVDLEQQVISKCLEQATKNKTQYNFYKAVNLLCTKN
ncbi:MAG: trigger factor [Buchnera aphidicola (Schlechtendalia peitan)]